MKPITVAVLGGGTSPERAISLDSAREVVRDLPRPGHEVVSVEILADGRWSVAGDDPLPPDLAAARLRELSVDVVFPALHGRYGEDGTVQGFLEVAGLPFVGSGVAASALAMDKVRAREVAAAAGLTLPAGLELRGVDAGTALAAVLERFSLPVVVKDPTGGSSIDLVIAGTEDELRTALGDRLGVPGGRALVEERVEGMEMTCAVLGNTSVGEGPEALPAILIRPLGSDWFDLETKYDPDRVEELCPAPVAPEIRRAVEEGSARAHRTFGCDGLSRTDFMVPSDGVPRFLEINTIPGLTAASLCPKAAAAAGLSFAALLTRMVKMALRRWGLPEEPS